jgi:hypothetical protein
LLHEVVLVVGQTVDAALIALGDVQQGLLSFCVFESQSLDHSILHSDDLVQSFSLAVEGLHDLTQLLALPDALVHASILSFLQFCLHESFKGIFLFGLICDQVLDPLLIDAFSLVQLLLGFLLLLLGLFLTCVLQPIKLLVPVDQKIVLYRQFLMFLSEEIVLIVQLGLSLFCMLELGL